MNKPIYEILSKKDIEKNVLLKLNNMFKYELFKFKIIADYVYIQILEDRIKNYDCDVTIGLHYEDLINCENFDDLRINLKIDYYNNLKFGDYYSTNTINKLPDDNFYLCSFYVKNEKGIYEYMSDILSNCIIVNGFYYKSIKKIYENETYLFRKYELMQPYNFRIYHRIDDINSEALKLLLHAIKKQEAKL